jgi:hypothetical protein
MTYDLAGSSAGMSTWTDKIVGARMAVDGTFAPQVEASGFSRQEWGLVMTAIEFDIENPDDPEQAQLLAQSNNLAAVIPELERVAKMQSQMQGGRSTGNGGILAKVRSIFGLGDSGTEHEVDEQRLAEARSLTQRYATELQSHLEEKGRWSEVCRAANED